MSDEHKPHEDPAHGAGHGHDAHGHETPAAHGHDDHGHEAPAAHGHDDHGHEAPAAHGHDDHGHEAPAVHAHDEHPVASAHRHDDPAPVLHDEAPAAHAHDEHGHVAPVTHDDHAHDVHAHDGPVVHDDHAHGVHADDAHHAPAEPVHDDHAAATAAAAAGAATAASTRQPVWSDSGDAPFEDIDTTPVYARGSGGKSRKSKGGAANEGFEIFKTIFFALLIALVLRVFLFQPFTIPSASMEPNLYEGDYIVVSKWTYGYSRHSIPFSPPLFEGRIFGREPTRGDIVVFKLPRDNQTDYIKRLIGLPGDRIQMIDNVLFINGTAVRDVEMSRQDVQNLYGTQETIQLRETLPEGRQINIQDWGPGNISDNTPVFEVPAGHYFMIGDNRDNSQDSRYDRATGVGYVPAENLIGKAEIILFSWSPGASLWNPVTWFSKIRPSRFFTVLH
jgi:signal peptidase I